MRQNNETKKASTSLKKTRKRYKNKNKRTITLTHKTRLKPLTREPKKSVFKARVKECFNP
ncbi:hypothetical protein [Helicobacter pylori]|uniref:hypothetical protein n=1 Tax=Helicobacter pylori TaxID=210 RepID=UPI000385DF21|nr:hypothetical protein [Helicobacter pylori]EPZ71946.1 hypothetical protein N206_03035 [Helicobacter pylori UM111]